MKTEFPTSKGFRDAACLTGLLEDLLVSLFDGMPDAVFLKVVLCK